MALPLFSWILSTIYTWRVRGLKHTQTVNRRYWFPIIFLFGVLCACGYFARLILFMCLFARL
jgi:hypothetical protein